MPTEPDFEKPRKHYVMRTEEKFTRDNQKRGQEDPNAANDVFEWRQDQRAIEKQAGTDALNTPPKYRYRRRRDFWVFLLLSNGFFGGMMYLNQENPFVLMFGFAGLILGNVGSYWILYHVLRKY